MNQYTSPNPTASPTPYLNFPATVVLKHLKHSLATSEDTGPTYIDASPLSADEYSPVDRTDEQKHTHHMYNGSHHRPSATYTNNMNRGKEPRKHNMNIQFSHSGLKHVEHRKEMDPSVSTCDFTLKNRKNGHTKMLSSRYNDTLTWRMDPSISLSDFTLTVIGINDKDAIKKHRNAKKEKKKKKQDKRRDNWMVEGLYLDMSKSDDENESGGECRSTVNDTDHRGCDQEHRSVARVHSTISGTKASNYPVVEKYHLHKVNLAVGQRSYNYFARLFQKETSNTSSQSIEMPLSCLPAIPAMLDFLYHPDPTISVFATTATAIPLRYLGTILGSRSQFESATHFLHMDLCPKTAIEYLQHAELYNQKKLADVCVRICAESFDKLKITWFASLSPRLMKRILRSRNLTHSIDCKALCSKIASYCRCQLHKIDGRTLLSLTDAKVMPLVCPEEALFFIQIMIRLGMDMEDRNHDDYISSKERSLYERCIHAAPMIVQGVIDSLSQCNDVGDRKSPYVCHRRPSRQAKNACGEYSRLPPLIKVDLLEYALAEQQKKDASYDR